jgi:hypothetical protein
VQNLDGKLKKVTPEQEVYRVNALSRRQGEIESVMESVVSSGITEAKEPPDLESFTQAHLIAKDAIHAYAKL